MDLFSFKLTRRSVAKEEQPNNDFAGELERIKAHIHVNLTGCRSSHIRASWSLLPSAMISTLVNKNSRY